MNNKDSFPRLFNLLLTLNPYEFTILATLFGFIFSVRLNYEEQQALGNFFEQLGQTLLTIGSQRETLNYDSSNDNSDSIEELKDIVRKNVKDIDEIVDKLNGLL